MHMFVELILRLFSSVLFPVLLIGLRVRCVCVIIRRCCLQDGGLAVDVDRYFLQERGLARRTVSC